MSLNVRLLPCWSWVLGVALAGCGEHVVVGGEPTGGPQSPSTGTGQLDSGWGAAGANGVGSNGDSGFGVAGWTASGGTRGVEMDAAATGGAGGGKGGVEMDAAATGGAGGSKGGADMDAVGTGGVGGGTGGTMMDAGFGTGGASSGRGGSSGGGNAGTSGSFMDAEPPIAADGSPPQRPVPPGCYQGQGVAPTPDRAAVVSLLVGKWVQCGATSVFGLSGDGIEFYADQSWANLIRTPSGTYEPAVGLDNRGKWDVLAVPVSGPASYQLTIAKDGGGGVYVFPSFTTAPRTLRLEGIFVSHYAAS